MAPHTSKLSTCGRDHGCDVGRLLPRAKTEGMRPCCSRQGFISSFALNVRFVRLSPTPAVPCKPFPPEDIDVGEGGDSVNAKTAETRVPRLVGSGGGGCRGTPGGNGGGFSSAVPSSAVAHDTLRFISLNSFTHEGALVTARPILAFRGWDCSPFRVYGLRIGFGGYNSIMMMWSLYTTG